MIPASVPDGELRRALERYAASDVAGVKGAMRFGDGEGRTMVLSCCTHGNEPCGLAAAWFLLEHPEVASRIRGTAIVTVNNLEGARRYFRAKTPAERRRTRLVDRDMNRLPEDVPPPPDAPAYEHRRLGELLPLFRHGDLGLDLHSFARPAPLMTIDVKGPDKELRVLADALPSAVRITHVTPVQDGVPLGWFVGGPGTPVPVGEVECGTHEEPRARVVAIESTLAALCHWGFLDLPHRRIESPIETYRVQGLVRFPDLSYTLTRAHESLGRIAKGEVLAVGDGPDIVAERAARTLFGREPQRYTKSAKIAHEILWLTSPPRRRRRSRIVLD